VTPTGRSGGALGRLRWRGHDDSHGLAQTRQRCSSAFDAARRRGRRALFEAVGAATFDGEVPGEREGRFGRACDLPAICSSSSMNREAAFFGNSVIVRMLSRPASMTSSSTSRASLSADRMASRLLVAVVTNPEVRSTTDPEAHGRSEAAAAPTASRRTSRIWWSRSEEGDAMDDSCARVSGHATAGPTVVQATRPAGRRAPLSL
jgi:hypothetical protein